MVMGSSGFHVELVCPEDRARGLNLHCPLSAEPAIAYEPLFVHSYFF